MIAGIVVPEICQHELGGSFSDAAGRHSRAARRGSGSAILQIASRKIARPWTSVSSLLAAQFPARKYAIEERLRDPRF
jgi:hypothetical protein